VPGMYWSVRYGRRACRTLAIQRRSASSGPCGAGAGRDVSISEALEATN